MRAIAEIGEELRDVQGECEELYEMLKALRLELQPYWTRRAQLREEIMATFTDRPYYDNERARERLDIFAELTRLHLGCRPQLCEHSRVQERFKGAMRVLKALHLEFEKVQKSKQKDMKPRGESGQLGFL